MEGYQLGGVRGRMWVKVQGIRSINGRHTIGGDVKNSMGNGETKELIRMTHGHELSGGIAGGKEGTTQWVQRGKIGTTVIA